MSAISQREIRAVGLGFTVLAAYTALVLASGAVDPEDFGRLAARYVKGAYSLWILIGLIALPVLLYNRRSRDGVRASPFAQIADWVGERWKRDRFLSLVWPPILFGLLMAAFNAYKQMVLPSAGFGLDPLFAAIDRMIFLGVDPWRITHALFGSPMATYVIDKAYHAWFVPMSLGVVICAFASDSSWRTRTQYLLSYMMIWIVLGSMLAFALPAAGPCFYSYFHGVEGGFDSLLTKLAADQAALSSGHFAALSNQKALLHSYGASALAVGGGISAMPSVHNALAVLFAITAFRIQRWAGWIMVGYAVMIWIGSIHLGWHYAIDGIVAALLTVGIWKASGRIADLLERDFVRTSVIAQPVLDDLRIISKDIPT